MYCFKCAVYYFNPFLFNSLGSTRFFKVATCQTWEGSVVVKVFVIHDTSLQLNKYKKMVEEVSTKLITAANCLQFHYVRVSFPFCWFLIIYFWIYVNTLPLIHTHVGVLFVCFLSFIPSIQTKMISSVDVCIFCR